MKQFLFCGQFCGLLALLATPSAVSFVHAQTLHTDREIYRNVTKATLNARNQDAWEFETDRGRRIQPTKVLRWGSWKGVRKSQAVWLSDGSWVCGSVRFQTNGKLLLTSKWFEPIQIELAQVRGVILNPTASKTEWLDLQAKLQSVRGDDDTILLVGSQGRSAMLQGVLEIGGTDEESQFVIKTVGRKVTLEEERIRAITFSPTLQPKLGNRQENSLCLSDGSNLAIRKMTSDRTLSLTTKSGIVLETIDSPQRFSREVRRIRNWHNDITFLSDLKPAQYRHIPDGSTLSFDLGVDRDNLGDVLWSAGEISKGIGMHSPSQAAYRWDGSAGKFLAEVVFAPPSNGAAGDLGSVVCKLMIAQGGKLETVSSLRLNRSGLQYASSGFIEADVSGAQLIVLVTEAADLGQAGDHVLWLDARVARAK